MADDRARSAVQRLRAQGLRDVDIARALGRDSGLIAQIRLGKRGPKYGASYAGALEQLGADVARRGAEAARPGSYEVPRREGRGGRAARVRRGARRAGREGAGWALQGGESSTAASLVRKLRHVPPSQQVYLKLYVWTPGAPRTHGKPGVFQLGTRTAGEWLEAWEAYEADFEDDDRTAQDWLDFEMEQAGEAGDSDSATGEWAGFYAYGIVPE